MAQIIHESQLGWQDRIYGVRMAAYLPSGVTITDMAGTLTGPSGQGAALANSPSKDSDNIVSALVTSDELTEVGEWTLDVEITLSNNEVVGPRFVINVIF